MAKLVFALCFSYLHYPLFPVSKFQQLDQEFWFPVFNENERVGVYRQVCLGIPLAVGFIGKNRRLWNLMVQETQRFRQVRTASYIIPYVLCGYLYCLRC